MAGLGIYVERCTVAVWSEYGPVCPRIGLIIIPDIVIIPQTDVEPGAGGNLPPSHAQIQVWFLAVQTVSHKINTRPVLNSNIQSPPCPGRTSAGSGCLEHKRTFADAHIDGYRFAAASEGEGRGSCLHRHWICRSSRYRNSCL